MQLIPMLLKEMDLEANTTRTMLSRVPADKFDWRPHPRSMTMHDLTVHIADLPGWLSMVLHTDGLDFATAPYAPTPVASNADLLKLFEQSYTEGRAALSQATDADLEPIWTLRQGETVLSADTKGETIRMTFSQTVHHRAQLGVYLRLLDIPIPGSYGPSADEPGMYESIQ